MKKTYSGKFVPKNPNKYKGDYTSIVYRSLWERHCFKWCDQNSNVKSWSSEEVVVPYFYDVDKKYHKYYVDLKITFADNKTLLVEIKPEKETHPPKNPGRKTKRYLQEGLTYVKNINKWKAANNYAKDRGWTFVIWTENTLNEMGIMPKMKPLKPLKPMVRKKKKP